MKSIVSYRRQLYFLFIIFACGLTFVSGQTKAKFTKRDSAAPTASKAERETIENIVREYLLKNPQIIREALQELEAREIKEKFAAAAANLKTYQADIYQVVDTPAAGNSRSDVPIVVFYDYYCGYCRKTLPALEKLREQDSSLRVIYKQLPIMGPQSHFAALAALAANRQGKFTAFHQALLESDAADESSIKEIANRAGLDLKVMEKDLNDTKLSEEIERNQRLATRLNISGTPAYVVGDQIIPGAIDSASLAKIVESQRANLLAKANSKSTAGQTK